MSSKEILDQFKGVQRNKFDTEVLANSAEYNRFQTIGDEFGGSRTNVTPIAVDIPSGIVSQDQAGNARLMDQRNETTMATDATVNSYRKIDVLNPNTTVLQNVATKFQIPTKALDEKDVIFKYVPLNNVANNFKTKNVINNPPEISRSDYYRLIMISLVAFIICWMDNENCSNVERVTKSIIAAMLGIIYLLGYLIKYTLVKCT